MKAIKKIVKGILPSAVKDYIIIKRRQSNLMSAYIYDYKRYLKHSGTRGYTDEIKLRAHIIKEYHIIEKGLTMPEPRLGFGRDNLIALVKDCLLYYSKFNNPNSQVDHAMSVILEYKIFHEKRDFKLDPVVLKTIDELKELSEQRQIVATEQIRTTSKDYFQYADSPFPIFSNSRKSVRNYSSVNIPDEVMNSVLDLSLNVPSACNRQTSRAYVFSGDDVIKVLKTQNGNRGFGHLANKVIVITSEIGVFAQPLERNQAYIDGGMYAMNLLYSLHSHKIAACILNCSTVPENDKNQRRATGIPESEVIIAMISCGYLPDNVSIPLSKRSEKTCIIR